MEEKKWIDMDTDEIDTVKVEHEKDYRRIQNELSIVEENHIHLQKRKIEADEVVKRIRIELLDNEQIIKKCRHNMAKVKSELRELDILYWRKRNG